MRRSSPNDDRLNCLTNCIFAVLDLLSATVQKDMGAGPSDITSDKPADKKILLNMADTARSRDYEAILSPPARDPRGKNLNIYSDGLKKARECRSLKRSRLKHEKQSRPSSFQFRDRVRYPLPVNDTPHKYSRDGHRYPGKIIFWKEKRPASPDPHRISG